MFGKIGLIIKALTAFKNVSKEYENAKIEKAPFYLHRRFIGAVLILASIILAYFSINIDENILNQLADNIIGVSTAIAALWGTAQVIIGIIGKGK